MLETLLKTYIAAMEGDVRSPTLHMFGPPGCGKSTFGQQLADLVDRKLHIINVSRLSPLELEGVQMPDEERTKLTLLHATQWTSLKDGDIVLLDEFLRGFPEIYNGLLDIMTSRKVADFTLPKVFFIAASNTTVAYDAALEDRLLHLPVADPRTNKTAKKKLAQLLVDEVGLSPSMLTSMEMQSVLDTEVLPMYEVLDALTGKGGTNVANVSKGHSIRNLIGQAQLRCVQSQPLAELIQMNNIAAIRDGKFQFVVLTSGKNVDSKYIKAAAQLSGNPRLTDLQARNLRLNLQLISMEDARSEMEADDVDDLV